MATNQRQGFILLLTFMNAGLAFAQGLQTPPKVLDGTAKLVQHYDPDKMLRLAFALSPPHMADEKQLIEQLHDKTSPLFHQFLTADQFNARFAPAAADEQAVVTWAQSAGFTITHRFANRLVVDVEAPAGVIEKALNVTINTYALNGLTYFSNDRDPVLPPSLAGIVQSVQGLNSFERMTPATKFGVYAPPPDYTPGPAVAIGEAGGGDATAKFAGKLGVTPDLLDGYFTPQDLYSSDPGYNYGALNNQGHCCNPLGNPSYSPPDSSIALATFGDVSLTDVQDYHNQFPFLAWKVQKLSVDGGYTCNNSKGADDACVETTLDTEWSLTMANSLGAESNTSRIYVYEGGGPTIDVYNQMLSDGYARVFSTSWGCSDSIGCSVSTMQALDVPLTAMVMQGWSLVAASGDQGATGACSDQLDVEYPASDPNVVAAGGTELNIPEVAWTGGTSPGSCANNGGGGTGGFSLYWPVPSYQKSLGFSKRATPDMSLNAAYGQIIIYDGAIAHPGGTSIVAPELAGFFAQENAYLLAIGNACGSGSSPCAPLGNPNYYLYGSNLQKTAPHYPFYDILTGCNSNDITAKFGLTPYCAGPGYDLATGWGSANMLQLAWGINWSIAASNAGPAVNYTGPAKSTWYNSSQTVSWTVKDNVLGSDSPTGLAGFTQGWDSIPSDPYKEATQGSGNSFYSGPQYPNATAGCLSFVAGGCSGSVGQGCHTAHVRAWNNMGISSGDTTYGPLCYDTVAPTVTPSLSPAPNGAGWNNTTVTVTLNSTDPGGSNASGVKTTYYGSNCFLSNNPCTVYSAPFTVPVTTDYIYYAYDIAGNVSTLGFLAVNIDEIPPVTTATLSATQTGAYYVAPVTVTLTATDNASGVASTTYSLDGGNNTNYSAPFTVSTAGTHTVTYFSTDVAGNVAAPLSKIFQVTIGPPSVVSVSPASGSATSQIFTATYSDPDGAAAINAAFLLFNTSVSSVNACYVQYYPSSNLLYLKNDAGTGVTAGVTPGSSATVSNSQCTLSGTDSSYSASGNTATLKVAPTFTSSAFTNVYLYASDVDGTNSGWVQKGTWGIAGPPTVVSVSPDSGSATSQIFTAQYADPNGAANLNAAYILFNTSVSGTGACWVEYNPISELFFLQGNSTGVTPGSSGSVSNSQCKLSGTGSSFITSGNTATMKVALTFSTSAYTNIYLYAADKDGKNSGWVQEGTWGVALPPSVVSVTPSSGSGATQTFTTVYSDPYGASIITAAYLLFNTSVSSANACYVEYNPLTNLLSLKNDAGTGSAGSLTPGSATTVSNSQCTLSGTGSSYSVAGDTATLEAAITFSGSSATNIYLYAADKNSKDTGWIKAGTWTP